MSTIAAKLKELEAMQAGPDAGESVAEYAERVDKVRTEFEVILPIESGEISEGANALLSGIDTAIPVDTSAPGFDSEQMDADIATHEEMAEKKARKNATALKIALGTLGAAAGVVMTGGTGGVGGILSAIKGVIGIFKATESEDAAV